MPVFWLISVTNLLGCERQVECAVCVGGKWAKSHPAYSQACSVLDFFCVQPLFPQKHPCCPRGERGAPSAWFALACPREGQLFTKLWMST